ncbi:MAG: signal peptidase II [Nitrososphaerota archaeon]
MRNFHLKASSLNRKIKFWFLVTVCASVIFLDQLSKVILTKTNPSLITYNTGLAFGLGQSLGLGLSIIGLLLAVIFMIRTNALRSNLLWILSLALILGGGVSNIIDRIRLGYVVDISNFGIALLSINLADLAVVIGIVTTFYKIILSQNNG